MDASIVKNMTKGQQIAAGGGLAALVASFLPWYTISSPFGGFSAKGTDFGFGWMGMVLLVGAAALTGASALGKTVGNEQIKGEQIALIAGGLGGLMWFYRLISAPFGVGRGVGLYLAVAAAAAVIAGIVLHMKEQGIGLPNAETFNAAKAAVSSDGAPSAQPAPQPGAFRQQTGSGPQEF